MWLVKNFCGIACVILAWLLMLFSQYALLKIVLLPQPDEPKKYIHLAIFEFFSLLTIAAHLRTILTDPGSVPRKTATPELIQQISSKSGPNLTFYRCSECCSVKPDRAHHCSVCKRCIRKMDHHCPWVNNCVGERNQKYFVLFTLFVSIIAFQGLALSFNNFFECLWIPDSKCPILNRGGKPQPENLIMLVFLIFEALLFALFGTVIFCMQIKAIWSDWTGIENLKKENRTRQSGYENLKNVFGESPLVWLSPFTKAPTKNDAQFDLRNNWSHLEYTV